MGVIKKISAFLALAVIASGSLISCDTITLPNGKLTKTDAGKDTAAVTAVPTADIGDTTPSELENGLLYIADSDISCHIVGTKDFESESLVIPGNDGEGRVISYVSDYAFKNNTTIKSLEIEEGITEICGGAFQGCTSLESISLPKSLRKIGTFAFYGCSSVVKVDIPSGVSVIGQNAFVDCTSLTEYTVSEENRDFAALDGILYSSDMTVLISCPTGKKITTVTLPDTVVRIHNAAFQDNPFVSVLRTGDGFTEIDDHAFRNCGEMSAIYLPQGMKRIGVGAFYNCRKLDNVYYAGSEDEWKDNDDDDEVFVELANTWKQNAGKCSITYGYKE